MVAIPPPGAVMGLTLISAVFGGYDSPRPLPADHGFDDAVLVTDNPELVADGWRVIVEEPSDRPRLAAKRAKLTPWHYVDDAASVWIDGSCEVTGGLFRAWLDGQPAADLIAWRHPEPRDCLYAEAVYCQDWPKYAREPIRAQTARYRAAGMPEHFGLYAAGTLLWRHTDAARAFGAAWLAEQEAGSIQDQVSLPFLLWSQPIDFATFDAHEYVNPYLRWHAHDRQD